MNLSDQDKQQIAVRRAKYQQSTIDHYEEPNIHRTRASANNWRILVKSYASVPPDKMKAAMAQAEEFAGKGDMQGAVGLKLKNVVQDKDSLTVWIDPSTLLFKRIEISSSYDNKPVTAIAGYSMISGGPNYMSLATLNYPEKELLLRIENFEYVQNP